MIAKIFKKLFTIDDFYKKNKEITKSNSKILIKLLLSSVFLLLAYLIVLIVKAENLCFIVIISAVLMYLIIDIYVLYRNRIINYTNIKTINFITYSFLISAYGISILLAFKSNNYSATIFPVMLMALPLLLIIPLKTSYFISIVFTIIYLTLSYFLKKQVFEIDLINCLCVIFYNLFIGRFFTNNRKEEFKLRQKYKHLRGIDELTELSNRRQFNVNFEKIFYKALNEKKTIALFLMDIDDFKKYNDYYGHLGGDDCLKKIGKFLKEFSAKNQALTFYRYGGEEFIGIQNDIDKLTAGKIARELVEGIRALNIKHMTSKVTNIITISLGVAVQYPSVMPNSSELINLADKALYKVKDNGKNGFLFF